MGDERFKGYLVRSFVRQVELLGNLSANKFFEGNLSTTSFCGEIFLPASSLWGIFCYFCGGGI